MWIFNPASAEFAKNAVFDSYLLFSDLKGAIAPPREKLHKVCLAKVVLGNFPLAPKISSKPDYAFLSYRSGKL